MQKIGLIIALMITLNTFSQDKYVYELDISKINNDQIDVVLYPPKVKEDQVFFIFHKIVPGTYEIYDFGQYVSNVKAVDEAGNEMEIEQMDMDSWSITNPKALYQITYTVDDTWDDTKADKKVFEPAGTNIDTNNILINTHGFFGYLDGYEKLPFELNITHPKTYYGSSAIMNVKYSATKDVFTVSNYHELVDQPIMYNVPDTTIMKIGDTDVLISVFSPNKVLKSKEIKPYLDDILNAQQKYLGTLPVKKYAFLLYFFDASQGFEGGVGALEHSYSSVYYLPETEIKNIAPMIADVAAHEFFHIVTPLNVHSEEIHYFDFYRPQMSKHLWLYEGVTEYFAHHVQVQYDLKSVEEYIDQIMAQVQESKNYNEELSFTKMSKYCLDDYQDEYGNVYQKGALIGLCVDILLRHYSDGSYTLENLLDTLSKDFGKNKPFKDDELFEYIADKTYPEMLEFFRNHVEEPAPLPLVEVLDYVGIRYLEPRMQKGLSLGGISMGLNLEYERPMVISTKDMNEFGKAVGYQEGDVILKINKEKLELTRMVEVIEEFYANVQPDDVVKIQLLRKEGDKMKKKKIKLKIFEVDVMSKPTMEIIETPTPAQLKLRKNWLNQK